jgi:dTDP-4-dehydrorhamnose reductase
MQIVVTGTEGQVAQAIHELASVHKATVITIRRHKLNILQTETAARSVRDVSPDAIINAVACTTHNKADAQPDLTDAINGKAAAAVAAIAADLRAPVVYLSRDYVFDGPLDRSYHETDPVGAISAFGRSKFAGEQAIRTITRDHVIHRIAWVDSPIRTNFVKAILRLDETHDELAVGSDEHESPTSAHDIADGILAVCHNLLVQCTSECLQGTFHMAGSGSTAWTSLAARTLPKAKSKERVFAQVKSISTPEYPPPAKRPANSRLECIKPFACHSLRLPNWQTH